MSTQPMSDPYAAIARPADPYAAIAQPSLRPAGLPAGVELPQPAAHPAVTMTAPQTISQSFDENTAYRPNDPLLKKVIAGATNAAGSPFIHPVETAKGIAKSMLLPVGDNAPKGTPTPWSELAKEAPYTAGQLIGGTGLGEAGGLVAGPLLKGASRAGTVIRDAAIGDPDAAAIRALKIPPNSPKMQGMVSSVQTARPYLQGAESLEDLQRLIPQAKNEIWDPYKQTIEAVRDNPVKGPDGMTTIGELEAERLQLSALNRGLKSRLPEAIQEAQQKGMSAADLLAREKAVTGALDPELSRYGIDPQAIRKNFGAVARVGQQVSGRDTLIEPQKPYGIGRMANLSFEKPLAAPGEIIGGLRDIAAGRPLFRGSPTDVGIREGFRGSFDKPNLGQYTPFKPTGLLESPAIELNRPPEAGGTPEGYRAPPIYAGTDASRLGRLLPASTADQSLPMSSYHEIFPEQLPRGRIMPRIIEAQK